MLSQKVVFTKYFTVESKFLVLQHCYTKFCKITNPVSKKNKFLILNSNSGAISVTNATIQCPSEASLKKLSIFLRELLDVLACVEFGFFPFTSI